MILARGRNKNTGMRKSSALHWNSTLRLSFAMLLTLPAGAALAADLGATPPAAREQAAASPYDLILELGAGAELKPAYPGASEYEVDPWPVVTLHYLWLPGLGEVKRGRIEQGFSFGPSFRYVSKRDSADYPDLNGLNDIDAAFELGGKFSLTYGMWRPFIAVRHGFGGHDGIVGEAGIDAIFHPTDITEITIGPRVSFANDEYMQTYFGVTPPESVRSGFAVYDPGGGFKGVGFEIGGRYEFTPQWALVGSLAYERLVGDAADSPIVQAGEENQFTARLGLSYRFGLNLFRR
jgi:outer membrane protein